MTAVSYKNHETHRSTIHSEEESLTDSITTLVFFFFFLRRAPGDAVVLAPVDQQFLTVVHEPLGSALLRKVHPNTIA
jgi:hypothetical protein